MKAIYVGMISTKNRNTIIHTFKELDTGDYMLNLITDRNIQLELTLSLLMSYIYGAPCKARNVNVVYIWTYVWQR
jgi:hypothetical protein